MREWARGMLNRFGMTFMSNDRYQRLESRSAELNRVSAAVKFILQLPDESSRRLVASWRDSKAQLFQDLYVLSELEFKRNGFFVEFGATNGVTLSNTFLLEKQFGWTGILAEPGRSWHRDLKANRSCIVDTSCVWRESGSTLAFNDAGGTELGTIDSFSGLDHHSKSRLEGEKYDVATISLRDLLHKHDAPKSIDYLSIDTEGSEYEILRNFDFDEYKFRVITCEHNFSEQRERLFSLFTRNGYVRKYESLSEFDDWYVAKWMAGGV
jgi:FkbM family methyltransferase